MRTYTPIHDDLELNDAWWNARGYTLGHNVWYNVIRDMSGRYDGYAVQPIGDGVSRSDTFYVVTVEAAERAIKDDNLDLRPSPNIPQVLADIRQRYTLAPADQCTMDQLQNEIDTIDVSILREADRRQIRSALETILAECKKLRGDA